MPIVDAHCHASRNWFEPVESLLDQMSRNGVSAALLVQDVREPNADYLFDCAARYPGALWPVVSVTATDPGSSELLASYAKRGAVGVRLHQTDRSVGRDPLRIWRSAQALGLPVSCRGKTDYYASPAFAELARAVPDLPIVLEHLGNGNHPASALATEHFRSGAFEFAQFPNVYIKVHGLGEFSELRIPFGDESVFVEPIPSLLERAYEAFGPTRLLWGSDFPPVSGREGYANALRMPRVRIEREHRAAVGPVFGENAIRLYRLNLA